jgi:hypothetical protein
MSFKPLTKEYLLKRGSCCNNGCKNCPYKIKQKMELKTVMRPEHGKVGLRELSNDIKNYFNTDNLLFVEVGSYMGESAEVFAQELPNAIIYCIDPWKGNYDEKDAASHADYTEVEHQFDLRTGNYKNIKKLKGFSTDFNTSCDVVYIDGIHTYEGVKEDILHWKLQLNTVKSVICGHDYYTDEEFLKIHTHISGVKQAIDELLGKPDKTYSDGSWIKYL